ncbi:MAG: hypothetical protein JKY47_01050 [Thalassospira sp.]|jgi:hypothetical protein|uniref:hypothetical protein n=1 Tax=Thalassospira sp. B30-1 TaxID=2785911 RepID=UPI0018CABE57|nr:hypothetical protein [Thalassospira sp. B30-1]MBL4839400.1 hypothetical protein [Thalassospira sp.]QPL37490.1 hypothetical protein IT971_09455 [Thalassospira sp. B30-1]
MTDPIALPTVPMEITVTPVNSVGLAISNFTFQGQAQANQGERWDIAMTFAPERRADVTAMQVFILQCRGPLNPFLANDPLARFPQNNTDVVTVQLAGAHAARIRTISTINWTTDDPDGFALRKGDYIQLGSGSASRLHMVLNDVEITDEMTGAADIDIWPATRAAYVDGATVVYRDPKGVFRLKPGETGQWRGNPGDYYDGITFGAMEYIT